MIEFSGIPVLKSIEIAPVYKYKEVELKIEKTNLEVADDATNKDELIHEELDRFDTILQMTIEELTNLKEKAENENNLEEAEIFITHLFMAEDPMMLKKIREFITSEMFTAEWSIELTKKEVMGIFLGMEKDYFKTRAADVGDIADRMIRIGLGAEKQGLEEVKSDVILAARDLKPSDASQINEHIIGILLEEGSKTSHVAIMAKAKGIPTIVGIKGLMESIQNKDRVILDSIDNKVILHPTKEVEEEYGKRREILYEKRKKYQAIKSEEAITKDGRRIKLYGNIGNSKEASLVSDFGGSGVGLFRTEFLYMDSKQFPTEEKQYQEYKKAASLGFNEVIVRTLDIGGDKSLPYYKFPEEENPFLGFRAIRFTLANEELFKIQLRAILRASAHGGISVMFPMISSLEEFLQAKELLNLCKAELEKENILFDQNIKIGVMIEIPSAAVIADILAKEVDFFSIGTNDLCQYTMAVDRMNKNVEYLYQPLHPAILRLIKQTVEAGKEHNKETGICGEMAGDVLNTMVLVGLGVDELSMSPAVLPEIKSFIRQITYEEAKKVADKVLKCSKIEEIKNILNEEVEKYDY